MNQLFGQHADPVRPGDVDFAPPAGSVRPLPVGGAEQAFFHLDLKRSLQLHWRIARNIAIAGVLLAIAYFLVQVYVLRNWPSYRSESIVYVQPTAAKVLDSNSGAPRWPYDTNTYESYIQQQMMDVTREDVMSDAVKKLHGFKKPKESDQAAAQRLAQSLTVTREGTAYEFAISARARTAAMAAQVANTVTASYIESSVRDQRSGDSQRLLMLGEEQDRIQKALDADQAEQQALNAQLGVASVGAAVPDHYDEDITSTRAELIKARTEHDEAEAKFASMEAGHGPSSAEINAMADEMIASDASLVSMKTALNTRRAALITQMANLTSSNPQYKQDEAELEKIDSSLESMATNLRAKAAARIQLQLKADLERTADVESTLNGQLRRLVGSAGSATPKMQRSGDLAGDITRLQQRFAVIDEQVHNLMLEDNAPASAYQVSPALPPLGRTKSGVVRNTVLIVFGGIFFGLLAAILAHKLDPRVYIAKDVELVLGFPPMAQLPDFTEVSDGVAEEYLFRLASSIEQARKQSHLRSCIFTGTSSGTGVTMLVNRVGEMLQAMGRPTVLVDATGTSAPVTHSNIGIHRNLNTAGLVPVERVSRPSALLQQMAEETETRDESLVLTDTAPLAVSAETEYLARFVDCAIVVVESGRTTRRELREAAGTLQRLDVAAVGFVLNRVGMEKADPAFRLSVDAIEKHLLLQQSIAARRSERKNPYVPEAPLVREQTPASETRAKEAPARTMFEPELAAAAAAVERFSHPAMADPTACLPSPMITVPAAESAKRFSVPFTEESNVATEAEQVSEAEVHSSLVDEPVHHASEAAIEEPHPAEIEPTEIHDSGTPVAEAHASESRVAEIHGPEVQSNEVHIEEPQAGATAISVPVAEEAEEFWWLETKEAESASAEPVAVASMNEAPEHLEPGTSESSAPEPESQPHSPYVEAAQHFSPALGEEHAAHEGEHSSVLVAELEADHAAFHETATAMLDEMETESSLEAPETHPAYEQDSAFAIAEAAPEPSELVGADVTLAEPIREADKTEAEFTEFIPEPVSEPASENISEPYGESAHESLPELADETPIEPAPEPDIESVQEPVAEPVLQSGSEPEVTPPAPARDDEQTSWWPSETSRYPRPERPPILWKPARIRMAPLPGDEFEFPPVAPNKDVEQAQSWSSSSDYFEREPKVYDLSGVDPEAHATYPSGVEDAPTNLTSRLSGLRNLLFVMGVKNPPGGDEPGDWPNDGGSTASLRSEQHHVDRSNSQDAEAMAGRGIGGVAPRLVTAPPEFLPPKAAVVSVGREGAPVNDSSTRQDRRAAVDGIEILPSRHGQYKKV